jgi:hypothetical protein
MASPETDGGLLVRECGDVCLAVWTGPTDAPRLRIMAAEISAIANRNAGSLVVCQFVVSASRPPDADARAEIVAMLQRKGRLRRFITVPVGDAFWVGVVRSIMRAFFVLVRRSEMMVIADDEQAAIASILEAKSARTPSAGVLAEAIADILRDARRELARAG